VRLAMPTMLSEHEKKVLELNTRKKIFDTVIRSAGSHFREIERRSGLSTGSVKYHLDYLTRHGLIRSEKDRNSLRYFPREFRFEDQTLLSILRQKSARDILLFVLTNKQCNHQQIVQASGLSPSTVSWHVKKLEHAQILHVRRKGRMTFYEISIDEDDIIKLLITYRNSFLDTMVDKVVEMWDIH
jgi:predicted transcriptional regulator